MKRFSWLLIVVIIVGCSQQKKPILGETKFQKEQNALFKDASTSPLSDRDRENFESLDFFKYDSTFLVKAELKRTPDTKFFNMKTTTDRVSKERVYGIVTFKISDKTYSLNIYQGEENMQTEGFEDYLFLPFLDATNGESTYGGGRYIDLRIPESDSIEIDFNSAYNPYCVYNEKYSCPIVPRVNYLPIKIEAGVKNYAKD
ncbi:DUF1684 domain-containing protein [Pontimicrobium aquaticum]|uniref:DUF1684 domain-containing protein n=1 Tax=Pontimicrobium aquaticum TaxID=2565367 RepID=A0A4U0EZ38_9FLAO|nr:DUF1684 domain-containing protein [Pontimicrobium aquaticum]TJY37303.1 DUF1684 domain-containing protein [Pontimicrobium aquaticum]